MRHSMKYDNLFFNKTLKKMKSARQVNPDGVFDKTLGQQVSSMAIMLFSFIVIGIVLFSSYNKNTHVMEISPMAWVYILGTTSLFFLALSSKSIAKHGYEEYRVSTDEVHKDKICTKVYRNSITLRLMMIGMLLMVILAIMMSNKVTLNDATNSISALFAKLF